VIATVRIVAVDFNLLPWDGYVSLIFPPECPPLAVLILDLGRIAVGLVAARLAGLVRHEPGGIELLMQLHILRRVMTFLRDAIARNDERSD